MLTCEKDARKSCASFLEVSSQHCSLIYILAIKISGQGIIMTPGIFNKSKNPAIPQEFFDRLIR